MTAPHPFIPLYFGEEDQDIWAALCRIEPEQRSAVIKELLRQALVGRKTTGDLADIGVGGRAGPEEQDNVSADDNTCSLPAEGDIKFDLADLFVPTIMLVSGQSDDGEDSQGLAGKGSVVDPANLGNETEAVRGEPFSLSDLFMPENGGQEGLTQVKPPLAPWENLLFNIIGTEDDENVIAAFKRKKGYRIYARVHRDTM